MLCIEADNYTPISDRGEVKSHVDLYGGACADFSRFHVEHQGHNSEGWISL
jgi:hypothetical protein